MAMPSACVHMYETPELASDRSPISLSAGAPLLTSSPPSPRPLPIYLYTEVGSSCIPPSHLHTLPLPPLTCAPTA